MGDEGWASGGGSFGEAEVSTVRLVLGLVMILLGSYVALHPLWANGRPMTSSIWFDMAFAALFLLRGVMNLRGGRKRQSAGTNIDGK